MGNSKKAAEVEEKPKPTPQQVFDELLPEYRDALQKEQGSGYANNVQVNFVNGKVVVSSALFADGPVTYTIAAFKKEIKTLRGDLED